MVFWEAGAHLSPLACAGRWDRLMSESFYANKEKVIRSYLWWSSPRSFLGGIGTIGRRASVGRARGLSDDRLLVSAATGPAPLSFLRGFCSTRSSFWRWTEHLWTRLGQGEQNTRWSVYEALDI